MRGKRASIPLLLLALVAPPYAHALASADRHDRVVRALELDAAGEPERAAKLLRSAAWKAGAQEDSLRLLLARVLTHTGTIEGRREAAEIYRKVLFRRPGDAAVRRELAQLERRRRYNLNARGQYEQILRRNPTDYNAAYEIATWYAALWTRTWSDDHLHRAYTFARRAAVPDTAEVARLLSGALLQEMDSLETARGLLAPLVARGCRDPRLQLLLASCMLRGGAMSAADTLFRDAIAWLPPGVRAVYDDVAFLSDSSAVQRVYSTLAAPDSVAREALWRDADPTAATPRNERRLEQWDRVLWSDLLFSNPADSVRGWDTDGGRAWIRYGRPTQRDFFIASSGTPSHWVWTYRDEPHTLALVFYDQMYSGRFHLPWVPAVSGAESVDQVLRYYMGGRPQLFDEGPHTTFPLVADGGVIFAESGTPWLALGTGVSSSIARSKDDTRAVGPFVRDIAVYDKLRREIAHYTTTIGPANRWLGRRGVSARADSIPLPPGRSIVAITMRDSVTGAHGDAVVEVDVPVRRPGALALSDVVLGWWAGRRSATPIPAPDDAVLSRPDGYAVIPDPMARVAEDDRLFVYFEVYRSLAAKASADVTITYTIAPERTKRRLFGRSPFLTISNTVREVVRKPIDPRVLEIDVSKLEEGKYSLTLSVHDEQTGQTAASTTHFEKVWLDEPGDPWELRREK